MHVVLAAPLHTLCVVLGILACGLLVSTRRPLPVWRVSHVLPMGTDGNPAPSRRDM